MDRITLSQVVDLVVMPNTNTQERNRVYKKLQVLERARLLESSTVGNRKGKGVHKLYGVLAIQRARVIFALEPLEMSHRGLRRFLDGLDSFL